MLFSDSFCARRQRRCGASGARSTPARRARPGSCWRAAFPARRSTSARARPAASCCPGCRTSTSRSSARRGSERVRRRWNAVQSRLPSIDRLLDRPLIFDEDELAAVASGCALTFGLGRGEAAYFGERPERRLDADAGAPRHRRSDRRLAAAARGRAPAGAAAARRAGRAPGGLAAGAAVVALGVPVLRPAAHAALGRRVREADRRARARLAVAGAPRARGRARGRPAAARAAFARGGARGAAGARAAPPDDRGARGPVRGDPARRSCG